MNTGITQKSILNFGLRQEEIDKLSIEEAICYIRYHHEKKYGTSSILFIGFSDEERIELTNSAKTAGMTVNSKISNNLTFICGSETADDKRIKKALEYGAKLLSKNEFDIIFGLNQYNLTNCSEIFDTSIPVELRIAKPLSNFDNNIEINSFSLESDEQYIVNIYKMTCSCKNFELKNRSKYPKGDIRRLCKHLINTYKNNFGIKNTSKFQNYIFENNQTLHKDFKKFTLDNIPYPVTVNYDSKDEWWNIFIEKENGIYECYGYNPMEERFSYGEVPRGMTAPLRQKLKEMKKQLDGETISIKSNVPKNINNHKEIPIKVQVKEETKSGCFSVVILPIIFILYLLIS